MVVPQDCRDVFRTGLQHMVNDKVVRLTLPQLEYHDCVRRMDEKSTWKKK